MPPIRRNPTLSDDLISEILVRVPVKSLLRFQSVCKTWLSLIKHPAFVKSQLLRATTSEADQTLIVSRCKSFEDKNYLLLHVDSRKIVADRVFPYSRYKFKYVGLSQLVGSANGIVCVDADARFKDSIYLWNPATRQSKLIPGNSIICGCAKEALGFGYDEVDHDFKVEALGFGYDEVDHDFKVVRVVMIGSPPSFRAEVYSDNRKAWRMVPDPVDIPCSGHFDVCVNGFLCGIGKHGMMVFDLNKEVLNCAIKLPAISNYDDARIIEFNNSLAVVEMRIVNQDFKLDEKINIWTLNDDACLRGGGVEASWTLLCIIDKVAAAKTASIVHGYFSKRDLLLLIRYCREDYAWISCDVDKKEAKIVSLSVDMADHDYSRLIYKYTESLVSLAGFKQVN